MTANSTEQSQTLKDKPTTEARRRRDAEKILNL